MMIVILVEHFKMLTFASWHLKHQVQVRQLLAMQVIYCIIRPI